MEVVKILMNIFQFISNMLEKKISLPFVSIENTKYYGITGNNVYSRYKNDYYQQNQITYQIYNVLPTLNIPIVNNAERNGVLQKIEFRISTFQYDLDPFINIYFDGYCEFKDKHDKMWHNLTITIENNGWGDAVDLQLKLKNEDLLQYFKNEFFIKNISLLKSQEKLTIVILQGENRKDNAIETTSYLPTIEHPLRIPILEFEVSYQNNQLEHISKYIVSDTSKVQTGYSVRQYLEFNFSYGFYTPKAQIGGGGGYSNLGVVLIDDFSNRNNELDSWVVTINPTRVLSINEVDLIQIGLATKKSSTFQLQIVFIYNKNIKVFSEHLNINIWNPFNSNWDHFLDKDSILNQQTTLDNY
jgi:hypothetical protein